MLKGTISPSDVNAASLSNSAHCSGLCNRLQGVFVLCSDYRQPTLHTNSTEASFTCTRDMGHQRGVLSLGALWWAADDIRSLKNSRNRTLAIYCEKPVTYQSAITKKYHAH